MPPKTKYPLLVAAGVALLALPALVIFAAPNVPDAASLLGSLSLIGLGTGFLVSDALLSVSKTLPNAASTTVNSTGIDLEESAKGDFLANCEILISAPALSTTILPDTRTMTYSLYHDTDAAFGTEVPVFGSTGQILQTGAGGAGAAAATFRGRLPTNVKRYLRLKITSGASTTDASATSATLQLLF